MLHVKHHPILILTPHLETDEFTLQLVDDSLISGYDGDMMSTEIWVFACVFGINIC